MAQVAEIAHEVERRFGVFLRDEVNPGAEHRDREAETFAPELLERAARIGLWGLAMPAACGGGGADALHWGVTLETIGYLCEDNSFPLLVSIRSAVANAIYRAGRPDLDERYVVPMVRCRRFGSFAYSDGTDAFSFRTTARRRGDVYECNGAKLLVTGGVSADTFMTYVRDEATDDLIVVLIDRDDPGVVIEPADVTGLKAAGLATLQLDGVTVPVERVLCDRDGVTHAQRFLNERRTLLSCGALGRMRAILELCVEALGQTERYGVALVDMQNVQATLGRMFAGVEAARSLVYRALMRQAGYEPGYDELFDPLGSAAKYTVTEHAITVATQAFRLLGGKGYLSAAGIDRFLRDFSGLLAGGGTQDMLEIDLGAFVVSSFERKARS